MHGAKTVVRLVGPQLQEVAYELGQVQSLLALSVWDWTYGWDSDWDTSTADHSGVMLQHK